MKELLDLYINHQTLKRRVIDGINVTLYGYQLGQRRILSINQTSHQFREFQQNESGLSSFLLPKRRFHRRIRARKTRQLQFKWNTRNLMIGCVKNVKCFVTGENRRFDRCIVDWTNQCQSRLPLVAKSAFLQTATAAHVSGPPYETFLCSGSLKPGSFGYLGQTALALIGPI